MTHLSSHTISELNCHQTALAIIPPAHLANNINLLRGAYDKAYQKWPAHINLVYPFVHLQSLPAATALVQSALNKIELHHLRLQLNETGYFAHKHSSTVYICPRHDDDLQQLRHALFTEFHHTNTDQYHPHLTVGQASAGNDELRGSLLAKARLLPAVEWPLKELAILVRGEDNVMRPWSTIPITTHSSDHEASSSSPQSQAVSAIGNSTNVQHGTTFHFDSSPAAWRPSSIVATPQIMPPSFRVSSYNVLVDSIFPPARERFGILTRAILSHGALADFLVLQEVSDDFLSHLLRDDEVRKRWPYVSHAPPDQEEIGPLLSLRNVVVLSRWSFEWEMVAFERRHKGAVVIKLSNIGRLLDAGEFHPLILAGLHLTCGLTDGAVAAKKSQLRMLVKHLSESYPECPWIVTGDFNMTTSSRTIGDALKTQSISHQTARSLESLEQLLAEAGFADAWTVYRGSSAVPVHDDDVAEGEEGATFDPRTNPLAAEIVGRGLTYRPQRYDRVLLKGEGTLELVDFNMFGYPEAGEQRCGSDHWGVRATIRLAKLPESGVLDVQGIPQINPSPGLGHSSLEDYVLRYPTFPTPEDVRKRKEVFALVEDALQQISTVGNKIPLVVVPVGSYGLDVWNTTSDIDCLCISSVSSKTFFTLAVRNFKKASAQGLRILRKVEAHSGTMLELAVQGVRLDIQYCAAARIADCWPIPLSHPATDPLFSMSLQTLSKLKAVRDLAHLLDTTPDLSAFRIAYRFLVDWAVGRGIYAARFGFLSGTHISLLLDRVAKLLHYHPDNSQGIATAAHLVCTFFSHYASFDWRRDIVEDPLTRSTPGMGRPYKRHASEPMVVLGYHVPRTNIARAASAPAVRVLTEEFQRANILIAERDGASTWTSMVGDEEDGAAEFLSFYKSYVRIDVQYWGISSVKARQLIGWVESRFPMLLVDMDKRVPEIHARIWPERYTQNVKNETEGDKGDQHGCYLIGLAKRQDLELVVKTEADRRLAQSKLEAVLERFSEQIRGNESFFDPTFAWVDVKQISRAKLERLTLDRRDWGDHVEDILDSDDEEDEDFSDVSCSGGFVEDRTATLNPETKAKDKPKPTPAGKKLRPATDILNRLRWDPSLDSLDYVVGYTDRFLGPREIALDRWKLEQTDEEFIPQHRILYFRRRSDGVKVWDREARIDELSGMVSE